MRYRFQEHLRSHAGTRYLNRWRRVRRDRNYAASAGTRRHPQCSSPRERDGRREAHACRTGAGPPDEIWGALLRASRHAYSQRVEGISDRARKIWSTRDGRKQSFACRDPRRRKVLPRCAEGKAGYGGAARGSVVAAARFPHEHYALALFFYVLLLTVISKAISLPLDIYSFHLEHRFHLSNQHAPAWILDEIKGWAVGLVLATLLAELVYWIIRSVAIYW